MQQKFVSLFNSLVFAGRFGHEQGSLLEYKENSDYSQYFEQHLSTYKTLEKNNTFLSGKELTRSMVGEI